MPASHPPPDLYAATLATTPSVEAPWATAGPTSRQTAASRSFVTISCAHLSPGRFHALDADVAVTEWAAAAAETEAYGTCRPGAYTSGAWISSANTRPPCNSTTSDTT